jgi:hypothetical protein
VPVSRESFVAKSFSGLIPSSISEVSRKILKVKTEEPLEESH